MLLDTKWLRHVNLQPFRKIPGTAVRKKEPYMRKLCYIVLFTFALMAHGAETRPNHDSQGTEALRLGMVPVPQISASPLATVPRVLKIATTDYCNGNYVQESASVCRTMSDSRDGIGRLDDQWCRYDQYHRSCGEWRVLIIHDDGTEESQAYCQTCLSDGNDRAGGGGGGGGTPDCTMQGGYCPPSCGSCTPKY